MAQTHDTVQQQNFVKRYLTPNRLLLIRKCIMQAHEDYRNKYQDVSHIHMSRTKANIINDTIVDKVKQIFRDDPEVYQYYIRRSSFRLSIGNGAVIIRFKKMDKQMRAHNIPTQQALSFKNEQILLFDDPSVNINVGYIPEGLDNKVVVACPQSSYNNHWVWDIDHVIDINESAKVTSFPTSPTQPPTKRRGVVPRRETQKGHENTK